VSHGGDLSACDLLIRGGTVIDGTGRPPFTSDVGFSEGWIVNVGRIGRKANEVIEGVGDTRSWEDTRAACSSPASSRILMESHCICGEG
jgi:hypothetical protein